MKNKIIAILIALMTTGNFCMEKPKKPATSMSDYSAESDIESPEVKAPEIKIVIGKKKDKKRCCSLYCVFNCFLKNK